MVPYRKMLWLSLCVIGLIMLARLTASASDPWAYFHPEQVKVYGCKVYDTEIVANGMVRGEMVWEAVAFAERTTDVWRHEVGRFAYTTKGRHKALKACSEWQDEAEKRVNGVHK